MRLQEDNEMPGEFDRGSVVGQLYIKGVPFLALNGSLLRELWNLIMSLMECVFPFTRILGEFFVNL